MSDPLDAPLELVDAEAATQDSFPVSAAKAEAIAMFAEQVAEAQEKAREMLQSAAKQIDQQVLQPHVEAHKNALRKIALGMGMESKPGESWNYDAEAKAFLKAQ